MSESTHETVDVLAVGAHPDDVEIGCAGTLVGLRRAGGTFGILHLTRGEAGTRGSAELRTREAERAAAVLGASCLDFLDCGDGALRTGREEEDALIAILRQRRPTTVLLPPPGDRHPDHGRAHRLVRDCCYYAGLSRRAETAALAAEPHRPSLLLAYMLHDSFDPTLIVDVSDDFETKLQALAAYRSQLWTPQSSVPGPSSPSEAEPGTVVASRRFHEALVGRARHFGLAIGADYGEPFLGVGPIGVTDLRALRGREPFEPQRIPAEELASRR